MTIHPAAVADTVAVLAISSTAMWPTQQRLQRGHVVVDSENVSSRQRRMFATGCPEWISLD